MEMRRAGIASHKVEMGVKIFDKEKTLYYFKIHAFSSLLELAD
ncbi:MAG TPA: hypothetical protein VK469_20725 [Candidatus Kapabacteria bacterium]|nr:hypothetical protein [Candidatus Kapabacteria bacterium]